MSKQTIKYTALLDGGLGQEIYRRTSTISSPLWSVAVMLDQPDIVTAVHEEFILAGAKTLTLNTYSATPTRLKREGMYDQMSDIYKHAFIALKNAIEKTGEDVDIAGCLGPLVGSYRGQPDRSFEDLHAEFTEMVNVQTEADVMLIETMTNSLEATAACAAARELGKPFGVAFRLEHDGKLKSGETLAEAITAVKIYAPTAIMLNCCDPEVVTRTIPDMVTLYPDVGGYANAFKSIESVANGHVCDSLESRPEISPAVYAEHVKRWLANGATVVGGCCEITPTHIQYLAEELNAHHYTLVRFSELPSR